MTAKEIDALKKLEQDLGVSINEDEHFVLDNNRLTKLQLSNMKLKKIPESVFEMSGLESLNLSGNHIKNLDKRLDKLKNLKQLILTDNEIEDIPDDFLCLNKLSDLDLTRNPLRDIPPLILRKGTRSTIKYLQTKKTGLWQSKMILVGQGGVGKSCLLDSLQGKEFDRNKPTTHGMVVQELKLQHPELPGIEMKLNVWDFGGQEIYHATHQFYLTNNSLFLLVWSARLGYDAGRLYYWLETIEALAPDSPIFIVATHSEPRGADLPKRDILYRYPKVRFCEVDNKTGLGISELQEAVTKIASKLKYMGAERPVSWVNATRKIRKMQKRYISKRELYDVFFESGMNGSDFDNPAEYLHEMGDILYYKNEPELQDLIIVNPEWVSEHIAVLLDSPELKETSGFLPKKIMNKLWSDLDKEMRCKFILLMEKFELAYRVDDPETVCLIVEKLTFEEPDFFNRWENFRKHREISLIYDNMSAMPAGIPTRFIARTHRFTTFTHWRNGALLKYEKELPYNPHEQTDHSAQNLALVIAKPDRKQILLKIRGDSPEYFSALLRDTLELTLSKFSGLRYEVKVPCYGHNGEKCSHRFKILNLKKRLKQNILTIECPDGMEQMSVTKLLHGVDTTDMQTDRLVRIMREEFEKQADTIEAENEKTRNILMRQFSEMQKYIELQFIKSYQVQQEMEDISCPNLFTLRHKEDRNVFQKLRLDLYYLELQLWCQHPGHQHPVGEPYQIKVSRDWLKTIAPYYNRMIKFLKWTLPLVSPFSRHLLGKDTPYKNEISLAEDILDAVGEEVEIKSIAAETDDNMRYVLARSQLNALSEVLRQVDKNQKWGGLIRKITPEGYIVWICEKHAKEYQSRRKINRSL